jgi:Restriction endonuclease
MIDQLTPHRITLTYDAALKSFWRKKALRTFLRECRLAEAFLSTWGPDESKREFLDRTFTQLQKGEKSRAALLRMGEFLADQQSFPDLENWEDSAVKISEASTAVKRLRDYIHKQNEELDNLKDREETQRRYQQHQANVSRTKVDLEKLSSRLTDLARRLGTQEAGYEFQTWFYDFLDYSEIDNRRPYTHDGRQIDGSLTHNGTTYLVELKFTKEQAPVTDIDSFLKKVNDKADNTMGIMVSISGYSTVAKSQASGPKTPIMLLDHSHLYLVLTNVMKLSAVIERVRRHASQTGEAFLSPTDFG